MFKKGFTLQELLITIGIIGIVAAIVAPGIVGMMPDQKKMMYMKAYNTLTTLTNEILDDPSLYWTTYDNDGEPNCSGMYCRERPTVEPYNDAAYEDNNKFPMIFASKVNLIGEAASDGNGDRVNTVTFTTTDGIEWSFTTYDGRETPLDGAQNWNEYPGNSYYYAEVEINLEPDNDDNNCLYSNNCTNPNLFSFVVDNEGGVSAIDALGRAYLQNPTDMHSASKDKEIADEILAENNNDAAEAEEDVAN